jgi:hypothetical protein
MKKYIYILGIVCLSIILIAATFKIMHWPGAGILLLAGLGSIALLFLPFAFSKLVKSTEDKLLRLVYTSALISFSIDFIGALFKIMHWPGAEIALIIGIPIPFIFFLPIYIIYHNKRKLKTDMNFFAILLFMIYLGVFSALLAVDPNGGTYMSYSHCTNEVSKSNEFLAAASFKNNETEISIAADKLEKQIEGLKMKLIQLINQNNKKLILTNGKIDYFEIGNKGMVISSELLDKSGFKEINQEIEQFEILVNTQKPDEISNRLIEEINAYRIPKYKGGEPILSQLTLITALNVMNDWQNKLLLISYLCNKREVEINNK